MSFVSHSARTVTVNNNNDNNDSNSDSTATTTGGAEANNNNDNTNGPATSTAAVVLRLASGSSSSDSSRKRGRSPTAAASSSSRSGGEGGGREGILKRPRTTYGEPLLPPYVPAPVPEIIANVEDATIPIERDSDLTDAEKATKHQRGQALRRATAARFYAAETVEQASFYEMLADERRDFRLTFGMEQGQTFAMGDVPHAAAAPEEEEFAPVRLRSTSWTSRCWRYRTRRRRTSTGPYGTR